VQRAAKKLALGSVLVFVVLAAVTEAAAVARPTGPSALLSLRLAKRSPLTLVGSGFRPAERVTVVVTYETGKSVLRVLASGVGSFLVRFAHVQVGRCEALSARATGNLGSRALLRPRPPACAPA
jgi:hypothetical protein